VSDGSARIRIYAQVGDNPEMCLLADVEATSHADVPDLLRVIADNYGQGPWAGIRGGTLPGIPRP
jgi:hypothetical protein